MRDYLWVALAGFVIVALALTFANHSRTGRAWRALRDDALAAEVMSMPVNRLMLLAIAVGAGVAGFAGAINGAYYQGVFPSSFDFPVLITVYAMVILGGAGSLPGVVAGAVLINVLLEVLRDPDHARWVFYVLILGFLVAKIRPWRVLAAVLGGLVAFGLVVHAIVGAVWPRGTAGPISTGVFEFTTHGWLAVSLRHWLVLPEAHVRGRQLPDRQLRVRDPDRAGSRADRRPGLVAVRAARADDLDGGLRLGDSPDRGVADDAPAPAGRDPDRAHGGAARRASSARRAWRSSDGRRLLELRSVSKSFGGLRVISDLDLSVMPGEIVSVIGPNGAGKTTLFNLISGIYGPDAGDILFEGKSIVGLPPYKITNRGLARTFQTLRLFLNMSVKENVMAATYGHTRASIIESMLRLPRARREERETAQFAEERLAFFGQRLMGYRWNQPAYSLSYANRRRLEIARATATRPKLLMLDEPAAGMNPVETHEITELIGKLRDEGGYTILVIEHDMHVVEGISDRVVALDHGVKIAEGSFEDVATDPTRRRGLPRHQPERK